MSDLDALIVEAREAAKSLRALDGEEDSAEKASLIERLSSALDGVIRGNKILLEEQKTHEISFDLSISTIKDRNTRINQQDREIEKLRDMKGWNDHEELLHTHARLKRAEAVIEAICDTLDRGGMLPWDHPHHFSDPNPIAHHFSDPDPIAREVHRLNKVLDDTHGDLESLVDHVNTDEGSRVLMDAIKRIEKDQSSR